jgi:hypothetical protein
MWRKVAEGIKNDHIQSTLNYHDITPEMLRDQRALLIPESLCGSVAEYFSYQLLVFYR